MIEFEKIQGHFTYERFRSNDYAVYSFKLYDSSEKLITVNGPIPEVEPHLLYELSGRYIDHKKYGIQFEVSYVSLVLPDEEAYVLLFLKSSRFDGIGTKSAQLVIDYLGPNCLEDLKQNPSLIHEVIGLNDKKKQAILDGLNQENPILEKNINFFSGLGLSYRQILKVDRIYGDKAIDSLNRNPYSIVYEVSGIGFDTAKKLATAMKFEDEHNYHNEALIVSLTLKICVQNGDCYIDKEMLMRQYCHFANEDTFYDALDQALLNSYLIQEEDRIYHHTQYEAEFGIVSFLKQFPFDELEVIDIELIDAQVIQLESQHQIQYDVLQKEAIRTFMLSAFTILTGGPGTGKTTVVKALIETFKTFYPNYQLAVIAPTGRASKRLKELCNCEALTIHSLLVFDLESGTFGKDADNPILFDALIIDEASMIDNWLFYKLLIASKQVKKICIIGDEDQLPSVGPGQLLKDLIESERFNCIRLNTIHRQKEGSDIIDLSRLIKSGDSSLASDYQEIKFYPSNSNNVHHYIADVVKMALEKGYLLQDIQVLSCMYRGSAGIDNLNHSLQEKFNPMDPLKKEIKVGFITFREEDKILQLKNQADDDVFNGDIGILKEIVLAQEAHDNRWHLLVDFDGIIVEYTSDNIQNITLAYCVSVHKSQGSEYPIVILSLSKDQSRMFQRKLLYTAVTRAKKSLVLVGDYEVYQKACVTLDVSRRTTLQKRLLP